MLLALGACAPAARPASHVASTRPSGTAPPPPRAKAPPPPVPRTIDELMRPCAEGKRACRPSEAEKELLRAYANDGAAQIAATPVVVRGWMDVLAMRVAAAYEMSGDVAGAIATYVRFVAEDASGARLGLLQHGGSADDAEYARRVQCLDWSLDDLATLYSASLQFLQSAEVYETIVKNPRLSRAKRIAATKSAFFLFTSLGLPARAVYAHQMAVFLGPESVERAELDAFEAGREFTLWRATEPDDGENKRHRLAAEAELSTYYTKHRAVPEAAKYVLEAAWRIAELKKAVGDRTRAEWLTKVVDAWKFLEAERREDSSSAPYVDYGAMAAYELMDTRIRGTFDGRRAQCVGKTPLQLFGVFNAKGLRVQGGFYADLVQDADALEVELSQIVQTYASTPAVALAVARQGTLFDEAWVCLDLSGVTLPEKDREMDAMVQFAIQHYARALDFGADPRMPAMSHAGIRLSYFRGKIGEANFARYVGHTIAFTSPTGRRLVYSPTVFAAKGLSTSPSSLTILPAPPPTLDSDAP